jgi:hypothetical protein
MKYIQVSLHEHIETQRRFKIGVSEETRKEIVNRYTVKPRI